VRRRRQALGLTLDTFGERSGLTPNYIGSIEAGARDVSIGSMVKLAAGLEAPLGELLGLPDLPADTIEAARLLSTFPAEVREPIVGALRALAALAGRRP
jgi:transcriptional regulator with XRE-family HTH domain